MIVFGSLPFSQGEKQQGDAGPFIRGSAKKDSVANLFLFFLHFSMSSSSLTMWTSGHTVRVSVTLVAAYGVSCHALEMSVPAKVKSVLSSLFLETLLCRMQMEVTNCHDQFKQICFPCVNVQDHIPIRPEGQMLPRKSRPITGTLASQRWRRRRHRCNFL